MDLSGRASGYRGIAIRCPGCAEPMTITALSEAEVDVCEACGGIWVDWFDGEVRAVTNETLGARRASGALPGTQPPPKAPSSMRNEAVAIGACPRCTRQLVLERYVVKAVVGDSHTQVTQQTGAELLRCEDCAGAFVSRTSAEALAALPPDEPPPPSADGHSDLTPPPWPSLLATLKRLLGLK